jgi:hypothetical protein
MIWNSFLIILLGYFNEKMGTEITFKPTVRNDSLHHDNNDNGVIIENFVTLKIWL